MANHEGDFWAVTIIKYKVKRQLEIGERVGTVSTCLSSDDEYLPYWAIFYPIPIEYATDNTAEIRNEIESYSDSQWEIIESALNKIDKPYKEDLYKFY